MKSLILLSCLASSIIVSYGEKEEKPLVSEDCLDCLCQLVSECNLRKGCSKDICGPLAITMPFWKDSEGIKDPDGSKRKDPELRANYEQCTTNLICSTNLVQNYMKLYQRDCNGDGVIDCLDFAAIHIQGPFGCLQKPFPEKKSNFMKSCLQKKIPGVYSIKMHQLIEEEKIENEVLITNNKKE